MTSPLLKIQTFFNNLNSLLTNFLIRAKLLDPNHFDIPTTPIKKVPYYLAASLDLVCIILVLLTGLQPAAQLISPLVGKDKLQHLTQGKIGYEVFGFAPFWTINKLDNVDFETLTTLAYFGIPVNSDGTLDQADKGYMVYQSDQVTNLFQKAHNHGTRVVLTITQMNNQTIKDFLDDPEAKQRAIDQTVAEVTKRGIDGINVDFEYSGNPGQTYRQAFSDFVASLTARMRSQMAESRVTVSVYASAVKEPKIYDIAALSQSTDGIFMMAYDFAVASSDNAIPTAPLYGHKQGKYWYDISSAVDDFLTLVPANKLILGVPYYGYNYLVYQPTVKAETRPYYSWRGKPTAQTYTIASDIKPDMDGIDDYTSGWDDFGKVNWKAYHVTNTNTWRIIFLDDQKSLAMKYDFVKDRQLAGIGMWALGFDSGHRELWDLISSKFGTKLSDSRITQKRISQEY